ncbi:hypothetical protein JF544_11700 [Halobacillus kuroshimensis]|uniref:Uncharacterized protein n=1 Tax=Halobacillus kuroshimensis TaxID=302481 RepID=A0ABS3DX63_9BACI|nr:hypothetical protein [Halobacillus kuroshimensis]MBN8235919.1 hypothetical protein [Halobacillus kuroshimensis]
MNRILCLSLMLTALSLPLFGFSESEEYTRAMWVEKTELGEEEESILETAQQNSINVLYVKGIEEDPQVTADFIQEADSKGIQVHALGGEPSWALEDNQDKYKAFVDEVMEYNQSVSPGQQFTGIHFKVQPQYLEEWYDDQPRVLREWKANITAGIQSVPEDSTLEISHSIPFWLDEMETPGQSDVPFNHWLIQQFDHTTILAFRDTLETTNGIVALTENELEAADQAGKQILVGITTAETGRNWTTFFEEGPESMHMHLNLMDKHLGEHSSYAGYAIDDYANLKQQEETPSEEDMEKQQKRGTYVWEAETLINEKDKILDFAKENNINLLYTRLDLTQPYSAYSHFVEAADAAGIEVHAMGGHPSWALKEEEHRILKLVDYVKSYNQDVNENQSFDGIHLDIEPYVEPSWSTDQASVLKQWMGNLERFVEETKENSDLEASMDMAMWFDDIETPGSPETPFNEWVIGLMDHTSVMAFRDQAEGIIQAAENEVNFSEKLGKDILISVEIKENPSHPHISFYEEGKEVMENQLSLVDEAFQSYSSYQGYTVHAYRYWDGAKE